MCGCGLCRRTLSEMAAFYKEHGFKMGCDLVAAREVGGGAPSRGVRFLFIDIAIHLKR